MLRFIGVAVLVLAPASSHAQFYRPGTSPYLPTPPPRVTPYLGLLNSGNPAANYYLIVQPQVRRGIDNQILGQTYSLDALGRSQPAVTPEAADLTLIPIQPQSGHAVGFGLTAPYFQLPTRGRTFLPYNGQPPASLPPPRTDKKF